MVKFMVGKKSDLPEGKMTHITAGGKEILVANVEGAYYAIGNICTHAGAELHEGELEGKENVEIISFYSRIHMLIFDIS